MPFVGVQEAHGTCKQVPRPLPRAPPAPGVPHSQCFIQNQAVTPEDPGSCLCRNLAVRRKDSLQPGAWLGCREAVRWTGVAQDSGYCSRQSAMVKVQDGQGCVAGRTWQQGLMIKGLDGGLGSGWGRP